MAVRVLMPALSPTMTEGNIARWLKKEGDKIKSGDILAEIETDKATMEVEAVDEGVLGKIVVPDGSQGVKVNTVIAVILDDGEDKSAIDKMLAGGAAPAPAAAATPAPTPAAAAAPAPAPSSAPAAAAPAAAPQGRIFASPLAKRMAEQGGVNLAAVKGSGPHGRIVKADIEAAIAGGAAAPAAAPVAMAAAAPVAAAAASTVAGAGYDDVAASNMRKVVAKRLQESKQQVPHFYLTVDCEIDRLLEIRKELNAKSDKAKLSVNDLVIRCAALALWKMPKVNAAWIDGVIRTHHSVDISVAVAIEDGLITPIIKGAERKTVFAISDEMKSLASRAREKPMKLKPEEFQGGTFSISNLGMFGVKHFEAIINPPQACILAVGAGEQRAVVKNGALAIATVMSCTLSVDHRVVDGALGAEWLKVFKALIEDPPAVLL
ncbi:MAG: pyruvate dehydrogenase complex dihydrolipoamide acetyltransferase [Alphaproteobacteria bacterium]|nr:pyruvate dehydrogenase complex dihydrolipoamide acetyltransferase [Alphaproteobacteria bacterium]